MEKIINKLITNAIEGVDTYFHNGSMWLIFTDRKEWVIELDKNGTLWYNYDFVKNLFNYASLGVIENQHYITMWVEDILQNGVKNTRRTAFANHELVEDILQNGVRGTTSDNFTGRAEVEDILQNGVRNTKISRSTQISHVEDIVQNGVKDTMRKSYFDESMVEDVIQNGDLI
jgi:hypothetical protein